MSRVESRGATVVSRLRVSDGSDSRRPLVLVAGATGYVGSHLVTVLEHAGRRVRCLARKPAALAGRVSPTTEVVAGDVLDRASLAGALDGVAQAFYLVHSMEREGNFEAQDRLAADNFAAAAHAAGVRRLVYLGGLGDDGSTLSAHLRSRHEVGAILRGCGVETIEFRASIVLGCGSLSFELIRALVERLPIMITPRWVAVACQPIALADLLRYLHGALDLETGPSQVIEIGGPDRVSYGALMAAYARARGLRRWMVPVPVLTPRLSSLWLGLVTPYLARVGRKLVDSLRNPTVVRDETAFARFGFGPVGAREAIAEALATEDRELAEASFSRVTASSLEHRAHATIHVGPRILDARSAGSAASPEAAFAPIRRIGGATGWYYGDWLWKLRSGLDRLMGGRGMQSGRRDPEHLAVGDRVDFWRVVAWEPGRRLRLEAEMKLPGRAWLEFEVTPRGDGARVLQTAVFDPRGLVGVVYWYALAAVHFLMFRGMLRRIVAAGESRAATRTEVKR